MARPSTGHNLWQGNHILNHWAFQDARQTPAATLCNSHMCTAMTRQTHVSSLHDIYDQQQLLVSFSVLLADDREGVLTVSSVFNSVSVYIHKLASMVLSSANKHWAVFACKHITTAGEPKEWCHAKKYIFASCLLAAARQNKQSCETVWLYTSASTQKWCSASNKGKSGKDSCTALHTGTVRRRSLVTISHNHFFAG